MVDKLWELFRGNAACTWGTVHEEHACEAYELWARADLERQFRIHGRDPKTLHFAVKERGLMTFPDCPWIGVSPDGIVEFTDPKTGELRRRLVEFKCPFFKYEFTGKHPYDGQGPGGCKKEYYDQI